MFPKVHCTAQRTNQSGSIRRSRRMGRLLLRASDTWPTAAHVPGVAPFLGGTRGLRPSPEGFGRRGRLAQFLAEPCPFGRGLCYRRPPTRPANRELRALCSEPGCARSPIHPAIALSTGRTCLSQTAVNDRFNASTSLPEGRAASAMSRSLRRNRLCEPSVFLWRMPS